jgi:hypothetical protein
MSCLYISYGCLYMCYYVLTCFLNVVFLSQGYVPYIGVLMWFLLLLYLFGGVYALPVLVFVYYLKYGIVSICVLFMCKLFLLIL